MTNGGCDDVDNIDSVNQGVDGGEGSDSRFFLHRFRSVNSRVKKANQSIFFNLFEAVEVDLAQMART